MQQRLRLFWAVNLSSEIKAKTADLQSQLKKSGADVKWVEEENFHLTVSFLGDTEPDLIPVMVEKAKKQVSSLDPFTLRIENLGVFPRKGTPKVIWAGVNGEKDKFVKLYNQMQQVLAPLGFSPEGKPFSPHLTLGRVRSSRGLEAMLANLSVLNSGNSVVGDTIVESVDLMQSELTSKGAVYKVLEVVKLSLL